MQGAVARLHAALFRLSGGRLGGRVAGGAVLLLNTTGRRSGRRRTTPLLYLREGSGPYAVVASNGGTSRHPAWLHNLRADPEATVEVGGREVRVRAEEATPEERARLWEGLVAMYSGYEDYRRRTDRRIPVVLLHPAEGS